MVSPLEAKELGEIKAQERVKSVLQETDLLSREMAGGNLEALYKLEELMAYDAYGLHGTMECIAGKVDKRVLASLVISEWFLDDLWENFGAGSGGGFHRDCEPKLVDIVKGLGGFIQAVISPDGEKGDSLEQLGGLLETYGSFISEAEERGKGPFIKPEEWVVLPDLTS